MSQYQIKIHNIYDERTAMLGRIKVQALSAEALVLQGLHVLTYAQLEGGLKELANALISEVNRRKIKLRKMHPSLLAWRDPNFLMSLSKGITLANYHEIDPLHSNLDVRVKLPHINIKFQYLQMTEDALSDIYGGMRMNWSTSSRFGHSVQDLVDFRNYAAHSGFYTSGSNGVSYSRLGADIAFVEDVLTEVSYHAVQYFDRSLHLR